MGEREMRDGVMRCPSGCDFDDLEIGTESQSFMAALGMPHMCVRCGQCGVVGELSIGRDDAIAAWNAAVAPRVGAAIACAESAKGGGDEQ